MKFIKKLLCIHKYEFIRNIYGDEIIHLNYKRSEYKCFKCNKYFYSEYLNNKKFFY